MYKNLINNQILYLKIEVYITKELYNVNKMFLDEAIIKAKSHEKNINIPEAQPLYKIVVSIKSKNQTLKSLSELSH